MKAHLLIEQLRKGTLRRGYDGEPEDGVYTRWADLIASAHKFHARYLGIIDDQVLHSTAVELWREAVLRLPFDLCYFEIESPDGQQINALLVSDTGWGRASGIGQEFELVPFSLRNGQFAEYGARGFATAHAADPSRTRERVFLFDWARHSDAQREIAREHCDYGMKNVVDLVCFMSTKHATVEEVAAPERLNKKRARSGKPPIYSFHTVRLDPTTIERADPVGGTHGSPRLHWRRGHLRTLQSGRRVPVAPCLVGLAEAGFVDKHYAVIAAGKRGAQC